MRKGWVETNLGEVLEQTYRKVEVKEQSSIPYAGVRWYLGGVYRRDEIEASTVKAKSLCEIREGDVTYNRMWATKGAFGVAGPDVNGCLVTNDFPVFMARLTHVSPSFVSLKFTSRAFLERAAALATGTTERRRLKEHDFLSIRFDLPPLAEQRRIVDVIESVDAYVAGLESYANAARTARAALLHELLTTNTDDWVPFQVRDLAIKKGLVGGPFGSSLVSTDYTNTGVPVIRGANLPNSHRFVTGDFVFVSDKKAEELTRNIALPGDIIATQRGTLGQVGIVPEDAWPRYVVSQSQMRLRVNENVALRDFVYLWLDSGPVRADIGSKKSATANPHINLGIFGDLEGRLPPLAEQKRIVDVIESVDEAISGADKAAADARNLRSGLLSDLLSGDHEIPESYDRLLESA